MTLIPLLPGPAFQCVSPYSSLSSQSGRRQRWLFWAYSVSVGERALVPRPNFRLQALDGHDGRHLGLRNVGHVNGVRNKRAARVAAVVGVVRGLLQVLGRDLLLGIPVSGAPLDVCASYFWAARTLCNSADDVSWRRKSMRLFTNKIHLGVNSKTDCFICLFFLYLYNIFLPQFLIGSFIFTITNEA